MAEKVLSSEFTNCQKSSQLAGVSRVCQSDMTTGLAVGVSTVKGVYLLTTYEMRAPHGFAANRSDLRYSGAKLISCYGLDTHILV